MLAAFGRHLHQSAVSRRRRRLPERRTRDRGWRCRRARVSRRPPRRPPGPRSCPRTPRSRPGGRPAARRPGRPAGRTRRRGSSPSGATAISPRSRSDSEPATASARSRQLARCRAAAPDRCGLLVQVDLDQHVELAARAVRPGVQRARPAGVRSTECTTSRTTPPRPPCSSAAARRSASAGRPGPRSPRPSRPPPGRGSPPRRARRAPCSSAHVRGGERLRHHDQVTSPGSRPAATAAPRDAVPNCGQAARPPRRAWPRRQRSVTTSARRRRRTGRSCRPAGRSSGRPTRPCTARPARP